MSYKVDWEQNALNALDKLDSIVINRILFKITRLSANFDSIKHEALRGKLRGYYKLKVGHYRVIFSLERRTKTIVIEDVGHRRDIYE